MFKEFICNLLLRLTLSDLIEIIGIFASLITSIIAIIISIKTLKQNSKMIEESTRPYIVIYSRTTNFQSIDYYLVIKNYGQTGAVITSFNCDYNLKQCSYDEEHIPFEHFVGTFIAPNQSFICNIDQLKFFKNPVDIHFEIEYKTDKKTYSESFTIHPMADYDFVQTRAAAKGQELRNISYTLQDLVEKQL